MEIFNAANCEYEDALKKNEFKVDFKYTKNNGQKPKNRSRNIIWFDLPFNEEVSTNIAKMFLRLINRLHKVFNRNTVKTSYSCMQNMSKIYKRHNSNITSPLCNQLTSCNCRKKEERSMGGKCQTVDAVYDCRVTLSEPQSTLR